MVTYYRYFVCLVSHTFLKTALILKGLYIIMYILVVILCAEMCDTVALPCIVFLQELLPLDHVALLN